MSVEPIGGDRCCGDGARAGGLAAPVSAGTAFPKMDVKLGHSGVVEMSYHKGSLKFAELMKERTGGAVTVHVFPANQLGSEKDMVEQVRNGVIHIALTGPSMLAQFKGWGPIGVLGMPYVLKGNSEEELRPKLIKLARGPLMADLNNRAAAESGIRILDMGWWYGERHLTSKTKQVVKPEDVKGLKIRTMDSPMAKAALATLGAATTPMAVSKLYTALQLGVVEGPGESAEHDLLAQVLRGPEVRRPHRPHGHEPGSGDQREVLPGPLAGTPRGHGEEHAGCGGL